MGETRHGIFPTECPIQQYVERGRGQPFFSPDNMADFHKMVVDDIGEVISRQVIGRFIEYFIVEYRRVDGNFSADQVVYDNFFARFYFYAHHIGVSRSDQVVDFFFVHCKGVAHGSAGRCVILKIGDFLAFCFELCRCVECDVGFIIGKELIDIFTIYFFPFGLSVGSEIPSVTDSFVEFDTQPIEGFDDIGFCARDETLRVGIFDAENHVSAVLFGEEVVIEGGTYTADVQGSRGTWGETHTDFSFCCFHRICRVLFCGCKKQVYVLFPFIEFVE